MQSQLNKVVIEGGYWKKVPHVHMSAAHGTRCMARIHVNLRHQKFIVEVLDRYELLPGC
jgi:hypothetical protein